MKKLNQTAILDQKIAQLTQQHQRELAELKAQFQLVQEGLNPSNIIQEGLSGFYHNITSNPNLISTIMSMMGGYLSKKIVVGNSENPIKKVLGNLLQFAVTGFLTKKQ